MEKALVIKSTGSWYTVKMDDGSFLDCRIKGKLRTFGFKSTNPVAVGDWVEVEKNEQDHTGLICDLAERKNYIIRRSPNLSKTSQIIAANIDQAFLIATIKYPETYPEFIDRFLVTAEAYQIPAHIIFNKVDIYNKKNLEKLTEIAEIYSSIGYNVIKTSAISGDNLEQIKELMQGKISLVSGNSGVGKSTLINALDGTLHLKVGEISNYHKQGKHTTTFAEMFELSFGGYIIDTPGIKGFGILDIPREEIYHHFPEIFKLAKNCKYYNCTHIHEPGCAVAQGVNNGLVSPSRYRSYFNLFYNDEGKYRQ
ncbi:MAG: ribosome small subunit-dependent GTPase A [Bacteroidales bacterium]|nr:ribosome small subunit-dependent GTPase A [Bacteroidales bacterium]